MRLDRRGRRQRLDHCPEGAEVNPAEQIFGAINHCIEHEPQSLQILALGPRVQRVRFVKLPRPVVTSTSNGIGAEIVAIQGVQMQRVAIAQVELPEDMGTNLRGPDEDKDVFLLFRVSRGAFDRMRSGIVLPPGAKL